MFGRRFRSSGRQGGRDSAGFTRPAPDIQTATLFQIKSALALAPAVASQQRVERRYHGIIYNNVYLKQRRRRSSLNTQLGRSSLSAQLRRSSLSARRRRSSLNAQLTRSSPNTQRRRSSLSAQLRRSSLSAQLRRSFSYVLLFRVSMQNQ